MKKFALIFCCLLFPLTLLANSQSGMDSIYNYTQEEFNSSLMVMGVSYKQEKDQVEILIDEQKALKAIPAMQAMGAMNPDISQTDINLNEELYTGEIGAFNAPAIIAYIYKKTNANNLLFKIYLIAADDYGNNQKHLIYSFNFFRSLYNKINWDNFGPENLIKVAPNFKTSSWFASKMDN